MDLARPRILIGALVLAFVAGAVSVGAVILLTRNSIHAPGPGWIPAGSLISIDEAGVLALPGRHVFVVANGPEPLALSASAVHMSGEYVAYCKSSGYFESPTHGETFDRFGSYVTGPAAHSMDRVAIAVVRNQVYVDPSLVTPGPPRGSPTPEPPIGPSCVSAG